MKPETETNITNIMTELDRVPTEEVQVVRMKSQSELLRDALGGYVQGQVLEIKKLDEIISKGLRSLEKRLDADELNAADTLNVINTLSNKKTDLTTAILDPFKPSTTAASPLLQPPKEREDLSDFEQGLKELPPESLKILDNYIRMSEANKHDKNV